MREGIKLIALDLDGTLLDADHATVPPRNIAALRRAERAGAAIAIASGRSWSLIRDVARQLDCVRYGITANGAYVLDVQTGKSVVRRSMEADQCIRIVQLLRRLDLVYELYVNGEHYVQRSDLGQMERFTLSPAFTKVFTEGLTVAEDMLEALAQNGPAEKCDVFQVPEDKRQALLDGLQEIGPFQIADALGGGNVEFTANRVSKATALASLADMLGLEPKQVMAFGDADNDREMLRWAGWSFAMSNAAPAAKADARYLAPAHTEAGVGQIIECFLSPGPLSFVPADA